MHYLIDLDGTISVSYTHLLDARLYYFDPPERLRLDRLQGRDRAIREGRIRDCYPMEGGVREILDARFEVPLPSEVDVWIMG